MEKLLGELCYDKKCFNINIVINNVKKEVVIKFFVLFINKILYWLNYNINEENWDKYREILINVCGIFGVLFGIK